MVVTISETQRLQLELIKKASANALDGARIVADLEANRHLWRAAMIVSHLDPLFPLRDLEQDTWNAGVLAILSSGADDDALLALVKTWRPDEVGWGSDEDSALLGAPPVAELMRSRREGREPPKPSRLLKAWWD